MAIDTHGFVKALTAAGVPEPHVEALRDRVLPELSTKQDLKTLGTELRGEMSALKSELRSDMTDLRSELRTELASIRTDMCKMSFGVVLATATLVTFLQKLL